MKVLVIDDDTAMTDLLKLLLEPAKATLLTANSAVDGVALAKDESPDVIILDLMMPDITGWELCGMLRKFSTAPILVLSALDIPGMVARALNAGADDYLIKPVTSPVLTAHINKLVRRAHIEQDVSI